MHSIESAFYYILFLNIRMLFFSGQAEYCYFPAVFRLKIILYYKCKEFIMILFAVLFSSFVLYEG